METMEGTKRTISLGKLRGLSQCADRKGIFCILALDHRRVIQEAFQAGAEPGGLHAAGVRFKRQVVSALLPALTAVLLDPSYGVGPLVAEGTLPGNVGLIASVEKSGYDGPSEARLSRLAEQWDVAKAKRSGASAVKLLVYYHPDSRTALATRDLVQRVAEDCRRYDIPLFLEPMSYALGPPGTRQSSQGRRRLVVQSTRDLSPLGADILKAEFPVDIEQDPNENDWKEACLELSSASAIPWVLLSAATDYPTFLRQARVACQAGASGILAGRSIWKEALGLPAEEREAFLGGEALERMWQLRRVCQSFARPFTEGIERGSLAEGWEESYPGF